MRRGGSDDGGVDDLAGLHRCGEADGCKIITVAFAARFRENSEGLADLAVQALRQPAGTGFTQLGGAGAALGHRQCGDAGGGRASARAVGEDMKVIEPGFIDQAEAVLEHGLVFGGKGGDQVGTKGDAGTQRAGAVGGIDDVLAQMAALHALEDHVRASLLTLDATTGQNALTQVQTFKDMVDLTGLIVTKLDGSARAGIVVALAQATSLPVHAIGVGEQAADLRPFNPTDFARALVGEEDASDHKP